MYMSFKTDLSIEECKLKFENTVQRGTCFEFVGKVKNNYFWIKRLDEKMVNSFARNYYGEFIPTKNGTIIKGKFKMHKSIRILVLFVYLVWATVFLIIFSQMVFKFLDKDKLADSVMNLCRVAIGLLFTVFVVRSSNRLGEDGETHISNFIKTLFDSKEIDNH